MKWLSILMVFIFVLFDLTSAATLGLGLCPPGEMYYRCGTACERTCQNPSPRICTYQCVPNVCQCDNRYVRGWDGTCVPLSQCSMVSGNRASAGGYIAPVQCVAPPGAPIWEATRNCQRYCAAQDYAGGYCDYGELCYCVI
ncbi:cysteine-rich venom protein 6-like [Ctenocephalides felis]|uniref:cysteine-rich venom protein 6-like n=1 Tax=Ctenocephalides felis TaxID=7515 RepID=UPI000E6E3139|nr:cysteine-rich venom protein 6-like [Ctenocephalides felis]